MKKWKNKAYMKILYNRDEFICPMGGVIINLEDVEDEVFASKMLGDGFAIEPDKNIVIAPMSGTITMAFPTKHGIGLRNDEGIEILIHIGIDTVELEGAGFISYIEKGQHVEQGDMLLKVDLDFIRKKGKLVTSMFVFLNNEIIENLKIGEHVEMNEGEIIKISKNCM